VSRKHTGGIINAEGVEIGDGQRGQDQHHEYPKMLYKGSDHIVVDDMEGEIAASEDGWSSGISAAPNPMADEIARLRAELAARDGAADPVMPELKRGPGRPPRSATTFTE